MGKKISIIIPVAPNEKIHSKLQKQLLSAPGDWEILICSEQEPGQGLLVDERFRWIKTGSGRANCLNEGARQATGGFLWFLHADSVLVEGTYDKLRQVTDLNRSDLCYFDLRFLRLSNHPVRPKEIGVLFRSRCLHTPFGDQGFFLKKELFEANGSYSVEAAYGEDHLFVRGLRRKNIKITPIGLQLYTSPRKYEQNGWIKVTILHQYLWIKQAIKDWWQWRKWQYENSNRSLL